MIMDLFEFHNVKVKKAGALLWFDHLPSFTKLFRLIEFCLVLMLLSWILYRLPFALRISGEFFRQLAGVISSPIFIFFLCNAIIVTLILKSGRFSGENPAPDNAETEFYEELLKNNENRCSRPLSPENPSPPPPSTPPPCAAEEIEFHDKEIISPVNAVSHSGGDDENVVEMEMSLVSDSDSESDSETPKVHQRWKSEKLERRCEKNTKLVKKRRRTETEKCMNMFKSAVSGSEGFFSPGYDLSDEDFQRAVEEFIAKHLRFRRQESLSVVLQN